MKTYSFIMEFRGGTYIAQHTAPNLYKAVEIWANLLNVEKIQYLSTKTKNQLIADLPELFKDNEFTPIETVKNIWLFCYRFKTGFAFINILKTDVTPENIETENHVAYTPTVFNSVSMLNEQANDYKTGK